MKYNYLADGTLRAALDYWNRQRRGRKMPGRRDIDPTELGAGLLPSVQLTEVVDGGMRFRYRLAGTGIVEAFGTEFTNKYVDELLSGEPRAFVHSFYRAVCENRQPIFVRSRYINHRDFGLTANRLLMPLSQDGETVTMIFGALTFEAVKTIADRAGHSAEVDMSSSYIEVVPPHVIGSGNDLDVVVG
jgi:hypothetical protein